MNYLLKSLQKQDQKLDEIKSMLLGQKTVLTFDEATVYTGFSRSHLYKLTSSGKIPHSKPKGKMIFFDKAELTKWLLQNPIKTADEIETEAANHVTLNRNGGVR